MDRTGLLCPAPVSGKTVWVIAAYHFFCRKCVVSFLLIIAS